MIKRRKKVCKSCGESRYLVGRGMCNYCYSMERVEKAKGMPYSASGSTFATKAYNSATRVTKSRHRKAMAPKKKPSTTDKYLQELFGFKNMTELFNWMWEGGCEQKCPISGEDLKKYYHDKSMRHILCAHLLPRSTHPLWKLNPDNVWLIHPTVHRILDQSTQDERDKHTTWGWHLWDREVERLKIEYSAFKLKHLL